MIGIKTVQFGCDPEFFFTKKAKAGSLIRAAVIGSEKVLPKAGFFAGYNSKFIIDGVQAEVNTQSYTCREQFNTNLANMFRALAAELRKKEHKGVSVDFRRCVKVSKKELMTLSDETRGFGCKPSFNIYGPQPELPDASQYLFRAAGGHLHFSGYYDDAKALMRSKLETIVKLMDYILANTCVLIDRDPGNIERRKVYGRAGEYRKPRYGLEYRVLSNFWLQNSQLTSLVLGLARLAISTAAYENVTKEIFDAVPEADIIKAINENDFDLAMKNFQKLKPIFAREFPQTMSAERIPQFEFFVAKGMKRWFRGDPMKSWARVTSGVSAGWETFAQTKIRPQMAIKSPLQMKPKVAA